MDETVNEYRLLMSENVIYNDNEDEDNDNELVETILALAEEINEEIEDSLLITENSDKRYDALMKATGGKWGRMDEPKQKAFIKKFTYDKKLDKFVARKTGIKGVLQTVGKRITGIPGKFTGGKKEGKVAMKNLSNASGKSFKHIHNALKKNDRTAKVLNN